MGKLILAVLLTTFLVFGETYPQMGRPDNIEMEDTVGNKTDLSMAMEVFIDSVSNATHEMSGIAKPIENFFQKAKPKAEYFVKELLDNPIINSLWSLGLWSFSNAKEGGKHYKVVTRSNQSELWEVQVPDNWSLVPIGEITKHLENLENIDKTNTNLEFTKFLTATFLVPANVEAFENGNLAIATNKKVILEVAGDEVKKVERNGNELFDVDEGWELVEKSQDTIEEMMELLTSQEEVDKFLEGNLAFVKRHIEKDGEILYRGVGSDEPVPAGWRRVNMFEMNGEIMAKAVQGLVDIIQYNLGNLVIITNKPSHSDPNEKWIMLEVDNVEDKFEVPEGFKIVEMNEDNFDQYVPKVGHFFLDKSTLRSAQYGLIKFAVKKLRK